MKNLLGKKLIFIDGGLGTMLGDIDVSPAELNMADPQKVMAVHRAYAQSGAHIITANTFGANRIKLEGTGYSVSEVINKSIGLVREAAPGKLAALDIGPTGSLLKPFGNMDFEEAYDIFSEMVLAGRDADLILIETMTDTYEAKAAVLAAKENSNLPVIATVSIDERGRLLTGADLTSVISLLEGLGVDALGLNCGLGPAQVKEYFEIIRKYCSIPVALIPNAGLPVNKNGETTYDMGPEEFSKYMKYFGENGAHILGGCCGTTPEHIRLMVEECKDIAIEPVTDKGITMVSAYREAVIIGEKPVIIGERINPTGKKRFKEALRCHDIDYIVNEGIQEEEAGAHILDVNVGLPEIDEADLMRLAVTELQTVISLPLQIDTGDKNVMEKALRIYNGKAMINSVNGKKQVMEDVFPLVKKYGGVVVGLTLDENGIPGTAEERLKIAERIIETAKSYGIGKKDIVIDPLTLAISTGKNEALETLRAVRLIRDTLGVNTILGVSNVSFGLPQREVLNAAFYSLALENGLSAAIINPMSSDMMKAYYAFNVLHGFDEDCKDYIGKFANEAIKETVKTDNSLYDIIIKGLKSEAYNKTKELLLEKEAMDIVNEVIIPALDEVGDGFGAGKVFLPQLLTSAETVKNAFEAIKSTMSGAEVKKGKVLVATVLGDVHDIGKNILKLLLENYGYEVIDMGKDVPPEDIVKRTLDKDIKLVGLSALMTTTVVNMDSTIKALKTAGFKGRVMVGGAVLTQEYADMISADFYCRDALSGVRYAREVLG